ncbi:MAG: carboxypeptidase regulatory-like domain-containing protein [Planctomycetota bacterium]|jgi:outer membrane lipoprotein-sorting protein
MRPAEDINRSIKKLRFKASARLDKRVHDGISKTLAESEKIKSAVPQSNIWRTIMKSLITKLAAAAVIVVAVIAGVFQFGDHMESKAYAEVFRPLLKVETGTFNMTVDVVDAGLDWIDSKGQPLQTIKVMFAGPSLTRWDVPTGEVLVANMKEGKVMILFPAKKEAVLMQIGRPGVITPNNRFNKLLALRPLIRYALKKDVDIVEFLGERRIEDVNAVGYHLAGPDHHGEITVWADAETKIPIRIEQSMYIENRKETAVISDIEYNVELDESLFSVDPPDGYSVTVSDDEQTQPPFGVSGTVTDSTTGRPIPGAKVSDDGYGPKPYKGAITDAEGRYSYFTWSEEHTIIAQVPGYKPKRKNIKAGLFHTENVENTQVINFALDPR